MCRISRIKSLFERRGPEVAREAARHFGGIFPSLVDDLQAGRQPVRVGVADRFGVVSFGYTEAEARHAALAAESSY